MKKREKQRRAGLFAKMCVAKEQGRTQLAVNTATVIAALKKLDLPTHRADDISLLASSLSVVLTEEPPRQPHKVRQEIRDVTAAAKKLAKELRYLSHDARSALENVTEIPGCDDLRDILAEFEVWDPVEDFLPELNNFIEALNVDIPKSPPGNIKSHSTIALEFLIIIVETTAPHVSNADLAKLARELFDPILPAPGPSTPNNLSKEWRPPRWIDLVRETRRKRRRCPGP